MPRFRRPRSPAALARRVAAALLAAVAVAAWDARVATLALPLEAERLVIEGTMESQLLQAQELVISHSGVFKGEVQVEDAEIAGVFDGTLTATGSLTIRATGRVIGTARSRRLSVEDGGQLSGKMEMITETSAARVAPAPRSAEPAEA